MKALVFSILAKFTLTTSAVAELSCTSLTDLSNGFPSVQGFLQSKGKDIAVHSYVTELEFTLVRAQFLKFLGDGWMESGSEAGVGQRIEAVAPEVQESADQTREKTITLPGGKTLSLRGECQLSNSALPGIEISLGQLGSDAQAEKDFVIIIYKRNKAEPSAAPEPPPTAAVLGSSETMNTKPESEAPADGGGR